MGRYILHFNLRREFVDYTGILLGLYEINRVKDIYKKGLIKEKLEEYFKNPNIVLAFKKDFSLDLEKLMEICNQENFSKETQKFSDQKLKEISQYRLKYCT